MYNNSTCIARFEMKICLSQTARNLSQPVDKIN